MMDTTKINLLIVDDDPKIRDVVERVLTSAGIRVTAVASLDEAREVVGGIQVDFVLLDLVLDDGPGTALVPVLREKHIPFRYYSQYTEKEAVAQFGTEVQGLVLPKGHNGMRMDLLTRIIDYLQPRGAPA